MKRGSTGRHDRWRTRLLGALVHAPESFRTDSWDLRIRIEGFTSFRAPSRAMEPTLPEGSTLVGSAWPTCDPNPSPAISPYSNPPGPGTVQVKRIIGAGGSTVELSGGVIIVDGDLTRKSTSSRQGLHRRAPG